MTGQPTTEHAPHSASGALPLPRQTTPTWEIELLISGATVFGLLQLPAQVEANMMRVINRTAPDVGALLVPLWIYLQAALGVQAPIRLTICTDTATMIRKLAAPITRLPRWPCE
jgi:hypothetical protein